MSATRPPLRPLVVPTEHGGWGFTLEPGILGILVAPGITSVGLAVFALFIFLADRPTRVVLGDLYRRRRLPRTAWAGAVAVGYGGVALGGLAVAAVSAEHPFWWVLAVALPFVVLQLSLEARGRTRSAAREMAGPIAIASVAAAAAIADGHGTAIALGLWLIIGLRIVVSVVLVRAQIRRFKEKDPAAALVAAVHVVAVIVGMLAAWASVVSWMASGSIALLAAWATVALALPPVRANIVGVTQMAAGLVVVVLTWVGYPPG